MYLLIISNKKSRLNALQHSRKSSRTFDHSSPVSSFVGQSHSKRQTVVLTNTRRIWEAAHSTCSCKTCSNFNDIGVFLKHTNFQFLSTQNVALQCQNTVQLTSYEIHSQTKRYVPPNSLTQRERPVSQLSEALQYFVLDTVNLLPITCCRGHNNNVGTTEEK